MYDLNKELNIFHDAHVILSDEDVENVKGKMELNIERLKDGLEEYSEETGVEYLLAEHMVQGSVAMNTVTQKENNEYDIDVAIVFDKEALPEGTTATKNIIFNALKKKTTYFKNEPEKKTNCIRVQYAEGYHIDFAIYRREENWLGDYEYEHCGSKWRKRDPKAITEWFIEQDDENNNNLRRLTRLFKMFNKSRSNWDMPGGLILSVLTSEKCGLYSHYERLDQMFYDTLVDVRDRLNIYKDVYNPTDHGSNLLLIKADSEKMQNLSNRLNSYIEKLDILFESDCSRDEAISGWRDFFNHDYWEEEMSNEVLKRVESNYSSSSEDYIENIFDLMIGAVPFRIDCKVEYGHRTRSLRSMLTNNETINVGSSLNFYPSVIKVSKPYRLFWKVKNRGEEAVRTKQLRGEIRENVDKSDEIRQESASFIGNHYVECYIVKNNKCIARSKIEVPIR